MLAKAGQQAGKAVFVSADRWFANEPFILEDKNENGDIYLKLEFKDVRIEKTSDSLVHANVDGTLIGGYKWFEGVKDFLVINKAPFDKHAVGNVFVNETDAIIRPFESFISSEEIKEIITTNINKITPESAISITQFNNVLIIYNSQLQPVKMNIYTIDGRIYKMIDVKSGENRIVIDVPGIYFIDNKKKLIK